MHQWESFSKLIKDYETQNVKDPFVYERFDYTPEEWDNVPPVIPRFTFYMQNCISKNIEFSKEVKERQTTADLRSEIYDQLAMQTANL